MSVLSRTIRPSLLLALLCVSASPARVQGGSGSPAPAGSAAQDPEDEVIKVNTALIQTGVAVLDKGGRFVGNLGRDDFEVTVDGKPVALSFFEAFTAGRAGATNVPGGRQAAATAADSPLSPVGSGRNIIFVVDDIHLSFEGHDRARKTILRFVEREMALEDTVAVVSTTGKLGFLQQFTDDKTVLRAAVARLNYTRDYTADDRSNPPMTEYEALLISQFDQQVTDVFAAQELGRDLESKREAVRARARSVLARAAVINRQTYSTLEQAVRSSARLPGRKVVVLVSDGWLLDPTNSDSPYRMRRIADAAARTNAVIYSFDAKGLEAGFPEGTTANSTAGFRVQSGERSDRQDGLSYLAKETGGRFTRNTNDLETNLAKSIAEASQHYLLAWQPVFEDGRDERWRKIEVKIKNRPDLSVRVHGGYFGRDPLPASAEKGEEAGKKVEAAQPAVPANERALRAAAASLAPARSLPVALAVNYLDLPEAAANVTVSLQIEGDAVEFTPEAGGDATRARIDLLSLVYNADGKREKDSREQLTLDGSAAALAKAERRDIFHSNRLKLSPGLYQVRVAARDAKSGRTGSAVRWVEVPDLGARRLATSSLIISERAGGAAAAAGSNPAGGEATDARVLVDRRVARNSRLQFLTFVYNASRGKNGVLDPDVTVQTQLLRGADVVVTNQPSRISPEGKDPARLPYAAEISLERLPPGRYELVVTVQDRTAKTDATQRVNFEIR